MTINSCIGEKKTQVKKLKKTSAKLKLPQQVASVAGSIVSMKGSVSVIDLMLGIGWLELDKLTDWQQGKVPYLEQVIIANLHKISKVMKEFKSWAVHSKLKPSVKVYQHKSAKLRFSKTGEFNIETAYRTHYELIKYEKLQQE